MLAHPLIVGVIDGVLPKRLLQRADGYVATIAKGEVTYERGEPTDALPGRLVRGARKAPAR